ncbi:MAG TPA: anthranilate phosphoribosyltransferase [Terriglobia bacterium]|nr:anthranilate phosphoribosyltransferase [Terriglobia bacterium]
METLVDATQRLAGGGQLTRAEARAAMQELLSGTAPDPGIIAFLTALRDRGETVDVLVGFAEVMRARAAEMLARAGVRIDDLHGGRPLLDTCGTGGDGLGTFNVSTATALVAAGAGVRVAKHGNRSISSRCGSADVLEALGVAIEFPLECIGECLETVGCVFLFAPQHHSSTRHVMSARRALKTKTVFNLLGPLTNPLGASVQLTGVFDHARTETMAEALGILGTRRAMVVAAWDGMDEISTTGSTRVSESNSGKIGGKIETRQISPEDFGVARAEGTSIEGGDAVTNARILTQVLEGAPGPYRPYRNVVLVNAAAALVVAGDAQTFPEGVALAAEAIDSGAALRTLTRLIEFTNRN